jgi:hypothetical protein
LSFKEQEHIAKMPAKGEFGSRSERESMLIFYQYPAATVEENGAASPGNTKSKRSTSMSKGSKAKTLDVEAKPANPSSASKTSDANGSGVKRKSRASTSEPESKNHGKMTANGRAAADADPSARDNKRVRRGGTPGAGGSRPAKKEGPVYTVKKGINALPAPIPTITKSVLQAGLASTATAGISAGTPASIKGMEQGEVLAREMFVFGNGDMGQHGLGTEALDEIKRPRRHAWVAKAIEDGKLGKGGLEMIAAGGMHSLAIDSMGRVSL